MNSVFTFAHRRAGRHVTLAEELEVGQKTFSDKPIADLQFGVLKTETQRTQFRFGVWPSQVGGQFPQISVYSALTGFLYLRKYFEITELPVCISTVFNPA
jgi:hypothetical protein